MQKKKSLKGFVEFDFYTVIMYVRCPNDKYVHVTERLSTAPQRPPSFLRFSYTFSDLVFKHNIWHNFHLFSERC